MKNVFIVPNNDAECLAIIEMIEKYNKDIVLITKQDWGASWSNLEEEIKNQLLNYENEDFTVYGIELNGTPLLRNSKNIDHHNYKSNMAFSEKTSIEQVSEIINHKMSIFEQFIAANDKGYMFEMISLSEQLNLSEPEKDFFIKLVNKYEYKAKNISLEDIEKTKEIVDNAYIYDDRLIAIELDNFKNLRVCTDVLYEKNKYKDLTYNNVIISANDSFNNKRVIYFGDSEKIDILRSNFQDLNITWSGGKKESGYYGVQIDEKNGENYKEIKEEFISILEQEILNYNRIVQSDDIINSTYITDEKDIIPNVIHEIKNPETFQRAISLAESDDYSAFVDVHDVEYYEKCRCFLVNAGCAGCAVTDDGNIISVFKNDNMAKSDNVEKISKALLKTAVENGGTKLDCFDGFLTQNYIKNGFIPDVKIPFNREFAPTDWDYERDGEPYIMFFHKDIENSLQSLNLTNKDEIKKYIENIPVMDDYDEAYNYRDNILKGDFFMNNENKTGTETHSFLSVIYSENNELVKNIQDESLKLFNESGLYVSTVVIPGMVSYNKEADNILEVTQGRVVYNREWGCPESGEFCYNLNVTLSAEDIDKYNDFILDMKKDLNQSTVSVVSRKLSENEINIDVNIGVNAGYESNLSEDYKGDFVKLIQENLEKNNLEHISVNKNDIGFEDTELRTITSSANPEFTPDMQKWIEQSEKLINNIDKEKLFIKYFEKTGFEYLNQKVNENENIPIELD